jgi:hypothetical protein
VISWLSEKVQSARTIPLLLSGEEQNFTIIIAIYKEGFNLNTGIN